MRALAIEWWGRRATGRAAGALAMAAALSTPLSHADELPHAPAERPAAIAASGTLSLRPAAGVLPSAVTLRPDFAGQPASAQAQRAAHAALTLGDARGLPFAVVDKPGARVYVFDATGRLRGSTPVLLGSAVGDTYFPDLNQRDLNRLAAEERTTPAGRFVSEPGRNLQGEDVVWIDYGSALAIHRLRPAAARERRPERLASATPADNRISLGCVITSVAFYEQVVAPVLGQSRAVIYILPDGPSAAAAPYDAL